MKIQKKKKILEGGVGFGGREGGGEQGGCEWRSEAFVKIQKKKLGGGEVGWGMGSGGVGLGGGARVDGNGELKLL